MTHDRTIGYLLAAGASEARVVGAPGKSPLSFQALRDLSARVGATLNEAGIGHNDRVAIVLPNGPEAATCFLTVASHATAAPLNPAFKAEEFKFYLADLNARAVVVMNGVDTPVRQAAADQEIPLLELKPDPSVAGSFVLQPPRSMRASPRSAEAARHDHIALVLHTSGTTARPKIVPLTHANLTASARNIGRTLALTADDVCLNIMPLFHIHGLIAAVLSSVAAGGSVICTPGLSGFRFFSWIREVRPTWYTAVPTMHQALLELAPRFKEDLAAAPLRFIRSSSASLPPPVMEALEAAFGVPVIEAYGMTEAAHQMASNPLPPAQRHAGSVGLSAGPDIAILGTDGSFLPSGAVGEVVIRGDNVTSGYDAAPEINRGAFHNGWFRTGDQGVLDELGYLRLTGRLKEIINRAGEKVAPLEIDNVLMAHPAVQQVVTFAMPSRLFGEDVAAAVVLHDGAEADETMLRQHVAQKLAAFKVPRKIVFLTEIPKGPTGKLQRVGLAERLCISD
jgi:oxalate---CoA ligase